LKKKIWIVVNPHSGVQRHKRVREAAERYLDPCKYDYEIIESQYKGHVTDIALKAIADNVSALVIAGGDGSLNEAAQALINTPVALGIIPMGSGNGLARHLHIPFKLLQAFEVINKMHIERIDTGLLNGAVFISNAGVGFVSAVVDSFNRFPTRGFIGYSLNTLRNYFNYKRSFYRLTHSDGLQTEGHWFMLNICNTNQFGYQARIAPQASVTDGLLDIVVIQKAPIWLFPYLLLQMFTGTIRPNSNVQVFNTSRLVIEADPSGHIQLDGETMGKCMQIEAEILPLSLKVIVPGHVQ
jgi:YegS/Rv2252/BmrU family lipid kinase